MMRVFSIVFVSLLLLGGPCSAEMNRKNSLATRSIPLPMEKSEKNQLFLNGEKQALPAGFENSKAAIAQILLAKMGFNAYGQLDPQPQDLTAPAKISIMGPFKAHEAKLVGVGSSNGEAAEAEKGEMVNVGGKRIPKEQAKNGDFTLPVPIHKIGETETVSNGPAHLRPVKKTSSPGEASPHGADVEECQVLCQRFAMSSMGPEFEKITGPSQCGDKCVKVFQTPMPATKEGKIATAEKTSNFRLLLIGSLAAFGMVALIGIAGYVVLKQQYEKDLGL